MKDRLKFFLARCKYLVRLSISPFVIGVLCVLRRFFDVQVGSLVSSRIGHLAANTEYWLRKGGQSTNGAGRRFLLTAKPINRQLLEMIKRRSPVRVVENDLIYGLTSFAQFKWPRLPIWIDLMNTGTFDYDLWSNSRPQLSFSDEEMKRGRELLRSMGIPEGAPFVCFAIRDKAYLEATYGRGGSRVWRYHDYRDADIENCRPMAEWLASRDIRVVRMGAVVRSPFVSDDPRIIDYASRFRSDFGDIYLAGQCKFFVGDTAGIFWVSGILGVPVALTNLVPITHFYPIRGSMVMPKKYRSRADGRLIPYREVVERGFDGFLESRQYDEAGIELVENTADEILGMVQEMNGRIDGTWISGDDDEALQSRFWSIFPPGHRAYGCPVRLPLDFLRRNRDLLN